jgi:hypothetical protein
MRYVSSLGIEKQHISRLGDKAGFIALKIFKLKESRLQNEEHLGPIGKESVYSSVLDSPFLPPAEKSLLRLEQEGALLVLAGTESPAKVLTVIFYHLLANPPVLSKLSGRIKSCESRCILDKARTAAILSRCD